MAMKEFGLGLVATGFPRIRKAKLINDLDEMLNLTLVPLWLFPSSFQPRQLPGKSGPLCLSELGRAVTGFM